MEQAHEALSRYLKDGKYHHRDKLAKMLKQDGFEQRCGYVTTKARRLGAVVVLGPDTGLYTSRPSGIDVLKDLRKRRKISFAYLYNVQVVAAYTVANWTKLVKRLDDDTAEELKGEVEYIQKMIPHLRRIFKKSGLE